MSDEILAAYTLAQMGNCDARSIGGRASNDQWYENLFSLTGSSYSAGAAFALTPLVTATHNVFPALEIAGLFKDCFRQTDSQQVAEREQRARRIRTVNLQSEQNVIRVFDFEKPFPEEETTYNPPVPQMPRILKLKR